MWELPALKDSTIEKSITNPRFLYGFIVPQKKSRFSEQPPAFYITWFLQVLLGLYQVPNCEILEKSHARDKRGCHGLGDDSMTPCVEADVKMILSDPINLESTSPTEAQGKVNGLNILRSWKRGIPGVDRVIWSLQPRWSLLFNVCFRNGWSPNFLLQSRNKIFQIKHTKDIIKPAIHKSIIAYPVIYPINQSKFCFDLSTHTALKVLLMHLLHVSFSGDYTIENILEQLRRVRPPEVLSGQQEWVTSTVKMHFSNLMFYSSNSGWCCAFQSLFLQGDGILQ